MALVKPGASSAASIKVVGIGGGGGNVINSMIKNQSVKGVDFIVINTDSQSLLVSQAPIKLQIGEQLTKGLGSGANPDVGRKAAEESQEQISEMLTGSDMVFITCGMGGGTGTGASPMIAEIARSNGALTVAVVTKPFLFEGSRRMMLAEDGIEELREKVDTLIVIPNQKLLETVDKNMTLLDAFKISDSVLGEGVQGISDLITTPGLINVDFADVKSIMQNSGSALMGMGEATGESKAAKAAREAISSPLLEISIDGAKGILFNITAGKDLTMQDVSEAADVISKTADADANIIFGTTIDESLADEVKLTVIATGFDNSYDHSSVYTQPVIRPQDVQEQPQAQVDNRAIQDEKGQEELQPIMEEKSENLIRSSDELKVKEPEDKKYRQKLLEDDEFDIPAFLRQKK
jgi:cell division protein FtsZ